MNNDEIKITFTAVDNISTIAEKIATAFTRINKSSALTSQQGLQQINNALGEKLNRSLRLSTDRTQEFLRSLDQMPKKVQQAGAAMVNVTNGNLRLATSFRDLAKAPAQVQKALENVMTQSEKGRLGLYRYAQELRNLAATGSVSTAALQSRFNQLVNQSDLSVQRQRRLWMEFFNTLPSEQRKASNLQIADLKRAENERTAIIQNEMAQRRNLDRQEQTERQSSMKNEAAFLRMIEKQEERDRQDQLKQEAQAYRTRTQQARQFQAEMNRTQSERHHSFAQTLNFGRIGLQSAMLGGQIASGFSQGLGGGLGAFANAAFLARPLMMAGPQGLAVAVGVAALSAALTGLVHVLDSSAKAAHAASQNMMQMQAITSLRGLPSSVPQQQTEIGSQVSRRFGFKLPEVQNANLNLLESGFFGQDAITTAAMISKAENKPIEEVAKDLADMIQSGQTESFTQKYRITSARVIGLRKPSLSAAYGSSKDFFQDVQSKLGPDVQKIVQQQPGERISASFEHLTTTIGSPVWQAFLRILQPISDLFDKIADEFDRMFHDQKFLDEMSKAFDEISAAMKDVAPIMGEFAKTFAQFLVEAIKDFIKALPTLIRLMGPLLAAMTTWLKIALILTEIIKKLLHALSPLLPIIKALWEGWKVWTSVILTFLDIIYDLLNGTKGLGDVLSSLGLHLKTIGANGPGANDAIKHLGELLRDAADKGRDLLGLLAKLQGPWAIVVTLQMPEIQLPTLPDLEIHLDFKMPEFAAMLMPQFERLNLQIQEVWTNLWAALVNEAEKGIQEINAKWQTLTPGIVNVKNVMVSAWDEVVGVITRIPGIVQNTWAGIQSAVATGVRSLWQMINEFVANVVQDIMQIPMIGGIAKYLTADVNTRVQMLGGIAQGAAVSVAQSSWGQQQLMMASGAQNIARGVGGALSTVGGQPLPGLPQSQPQTMVVGGVAADFPFGVGFSAGGPNTPNPFDRKPRDRNFNSDVSGDNTDLNNPVQVVGPSGYDVSPNTSGSTTINVYIQGGDFGDSAAVKARAREVGDQIGLNLRGRGGIQIP